MHLSAITSLTICKQRRWHGLYGQPNLWVDGDGLTRPFKLASHTLFAKWFPTAVIATTSSDLQRGTHTTPNTYNTA